MKEESLIKVMNFLKSLFKSKKQDIDTFYSILNQSEWKNFIGKDEVKMIKGVIEVSELEVKDIMIPRSNMILLETSHSFDELLRTIIDSGHSRFPVIADNKDEVLGILLAKDLLKFSKDGEDSFEMDSFLRPATFIPESKRLKTLLREFRKSRNHIAIVVDEYGRTAGLLTIEDVLEQIVGDIEDEYDIEDVPLIKEVKKNKFIVDALIRIEDFNEFFGTEFLDEDYDTLGGLLTQTIGRLPNKNEIVDLKLIRCKIIESNTRRIDTVEVARID